jgi:hypothetical protein
LARCLVPASTFTASIPKSVGLTRPKKFIGTTSRITGRQLNNCNQHRASQDANSTTVINIAHHRTPTLQLQATSRIAELQLYNCKQHRTSQDANSTTANNIAHRQTPTLQLQTTSHIARRQLYNCK